jgi:hypothetical protein
MASNAVELDTASTCVAWINKEVPARVQDLFARVVDTQKSRTLLPSPTDPKVLGLSDRMDYRWNRVESIDSSRTRRPLSK